jgi:hypothetical protein
MGAAEAISFEEVRARKQWTDFSVSPSGVSTTQGKHSSWNFEGENR